MTILGIETSDNYVGVGLADENGIILSRASKPELRNKNLLHQFLTDNLNDTGKTIADLEGVAVSIGPGSFTGLRVGLAAAKGICWSRNIPLAGISSTAAIAKTSGLNEGKFLAVKDARRNEYYYGGFECDGADCRRVLPDGIGDIDDLLRFQSDGFHIMGHRQLLENSGIRGIMEYDPKDLGGIVALMGFKKIAEGDTMDIASGAPRYLRNPGIVPTRR